MRKRIKSILLLAGTALVLSACGHEEEPCGIDCIPCPDPPTHEGDPA